MVEYAVGQKVKVKDLKYSNAIGIIEELRINKEYFNNSFYLTCLVRLNEVPSNYNIKGEMSVWVRSEDLEVIEDVTIEEDQEAEEIRQATKEQQEETIKQARQTTQEEQEAITRVNELLKKLDIEALTKAIIEISETLKTVGKVIGEACQKYIEENQIEVDEEFEKAKIEALFNKKDGGKDE